MTAAKFTNPAGATSLAGGNRFMPMFNWALISAMKLPEKFNRLWEVRPVSRFQILLAVSIAVAADALQWLLGPIGWALIDQAIDLVTMVLVCWCLGFHLLFLPAFIVELIPVVEDLPTWTACVLAVLALRKRSQHQRPSKATE